MVISDYLPHKGKMILVDNVYLGNNIGGYIYGWGERKLKKTEYWAKGHFGVMPATAMLETMAQTAGCIFMSENKEYIDKAFYLVGIESAKFIKPVYVGDDIEIFVQIHPSRMKIVKVDCMIKKNNKKVAESTIILWGDNERHRCN